MFKKLFKRQLNKGFTLMEMLVVVAIIAIIVAIAIPAIGDKLEHSKQVADNTNIRAMYTEALAQQTVTQVKTVRWVKTPMEAAYDGKTVFNGLTMKTKWAKGNYVSITITADGEASLSASASIGEDVN